MIMPKNNFPEYIVHDLLSEVPGMSYRGMFGGYGIYKDGLIVGVIVSDELYLKVDDTNRQDYENAGSHPFVYSSKNGKETSMGYWTVPPEVLEDRKELERWTLKSYEVSKRAKAAKAKK